MRKSSRGYSGGLIGTIGTDYYNSFLDRILKEGPRAIGVLRNEEAMLFLLAVIAKSTLDNSAINRRIFKMLSLQNPFGVTYGTDIPLQSGVETTQLDFVRGRHINVPANTNVKIPYRPVQTLIIKNLSTTQSIRYSTNPFENNLINTDNVLGPDEQITIETKVPSIRRLNVIALNGATARIILII